MPGIFISYRRQDSQSAAGRLADHVKEHMAGVPVFRDVETIEPGVDFVEAIDRALQSCGVLLAVIGPRWLVLNDAHGKRRLDDPDDYTRLEVATALQRPNVRVIPVLVEGAQMPSGDELPPDLKPLARRNAIELTDKRWEYDVSQLIETLNKVLEITPPPPKPEPRPEPKFEPRPQPSPAPRPEPPAAGNWFQRLSPVARWSLVSVATLIALASFYAEEETPPGSLPPQVELMPAPAATVPPTGAVDTAALPAPDTTADYGASPGAPNLTGMWQDNEGGAHQIVQNGNQIQVQGLSPDGYVAGVGMMQGRSGWVEYTLNGYPLRAQVEATPDGMRLRIIVVDRATGAQEVLAMQRVR